MKNYNKQEQSKKEFLLIVLINFFVLIFIAYIICNLFDPLLVEEEKVKYANLMDVHCKMLSEETTRKITLTTPQGQKVRYILLPEEYKKLKSDAQSKQLNNICFGIFLGVSGITFSIGLLTMEDNYGFGLGPLWNYFTKK